MFLGLLIQNFMFFNWKQTDWLLIWHAFAFLMLLGTKFDRISYRTREFWHIVTAITGVVVICICGSHVVNQDHLESEERMAVQAQMFWLRIEVFLWTGLLCSTMIFMLANHLCAASFAQEEFEAFHQLTYNDLSQNDYVEVHYEDIGLFSVNVTPFFSHVFMLVFALPPRGTITDDDPKQKNLYILTGISTVQAIACMIFFFTDIRNDYTKNANATWTSIKNWLFVSSFLTITVLVPVSLWIVIGLSVKNFNNDPYIGWIFAYGFLSIYTAVHFCLRIESCS